MPIDRDGSLTRLGAAASRMGFPLMRALRNFDSASAALLDGRAATSLSNWCGPAGEPCPMLAAIIRRDGDPETVQLGDHPTLIPAAGQVRVRVRAASLNPIDSKLRAGSFRPFLRLRFPAILGFDLAG